MPAREEPRRERRRDAGGREALHVDDDLGLGSASIASQICVTTSSGTTTGTRPFFVQLLRKMSLKLGAITASKPPCWMAHTACSRDEPVPKLPGRRRGSTRRRSARR
jgi:hypothetical protein